MGEKRACVLKGHGAPSKSSPKGPRLDVTRGKNFSIPSPLPYSQTHTHTSTQERAREERVVFDFFFFLNWEKSATRMSSHVQVKFRNSPPCLPSFLPFSFSLIEEKTTTTTTTTTTIVTWRTLKALHFIIYMRTKKSCVCLFVFFSSKTTRANQLGRWWRPFLSFQLSAVEFFFSFF